MTVGEWAVAFGLTLAVELPVYVAVLVGLIGVPWRRAAALAFAVNLLTHPLVWIALHPALADGGRYAGVVLAVEGAVVFVEAVLLQAKVGREALLIAATALTVNAASVLVGIAVIG